MVKQHLEVERKYDVDLTTQLPQLGGLGESGESGELGGPGAVAGAAYQLTLSATYFDTEDLRLGDAGITLRHRSGGSDDGWHLKLPADRGRIEMRSTAKAPPEPVPEELQALVRSVVRHRPLLPVAELRTTRTVHPLLDASGRILLELVDDLVEGQPAAGDPVRWREWEAELVAGDEPLLDAVEQQLLTAGATPSTAASKVGRVLDQSSGAHRPQRPAARSRRATAGQVLQVRLAEQVAELVARDPQVRRDEPDAVHKMRVATRRLRSAMSTFRPLLDRGRTDPLRDELRWLAGSLGAARDAEVLHDRLLGLLDGEPPELVLGPVHRKVDDVLSSRYRTAHASVLTDLDSDRYLALLDALEHLAASPAWRAPAAEPAREVLPGLVAKADRRLVRAVRVATQAAGQPGSEQDTALHEARKLAKRLRYACETVEPRFGKKASRLASAATDLQEVLGEHQDSVVTRDVLLELGAGTSRSGRVGFTFGRLHGLEQAKEQLRADEWRRVWKRASRRKLRRWLSS